MRSDDETIKRFLKADGVAVRVELLDEEGRVIDAADRAVEARLTRASGSRLITIRVDAAELVELRL